MKKLTLNRRPDGKTFLHTWRTGNIYYEKNRALLLRDWTNLQHRYHCNHTGRDGVLIHDSRRGLPAPDGAFDAVYTCHVIEHMTYAEAHVYLHELCRVLKPGGVLRISTPHLAREAREYVRMVDLCLADPNAANDRRYELAVRALIDQFTRQRSGGELIKHFHSAELDRAYALERYGDVWREFVPDLAQSVPGTKAKHWIKRVGLTDWRQWRDLVKLRLLRWLTNEHSLLEGENEKWEWDSYSLGKACRQTGLVQVSSNLFNESRIPGWNLYQLDTSHDGLTAIEHSLYLEAVKPK